MFSASSFKIVKNAVFMICLSIFMVRLIAEVATVVNVISLY